MFPLRPVALGLLAALLAFFGTGDTKTFGDLIHEFDDGTYTIVNAFALDDFNGGLDTNWVKVGDPNNTTLITGASTLEVVIDGAGGLSWTFGDQPTVAMYLRFVPEYTPASGGEITFSLLDDGVVKVSAVIDIQNGTLLFTTEDGETQTLLRDDLHSGIGAPVSLFIGTANANADFLEVECICYDEGGMKHWWYPMPSDSQDPPFDEVQLLASGSSSPVGLLLDDFAAGTTGTMPDPPVGGIAELPEVAGTPLETDGSSGPSASVVAGIVAAVATGLVALIGAAWYARRRVIS